MVTREQKNEKMQRELILEENIEKIKSTGFKLGKFFTVIVVILFLIYAILRYLGTYGLIIKETTISSKKLPDSFISTKIVQFSDTHVGSSTTILDIEKLKNEINKLNPDIVVFTGDLLEKDLTDNDKEKLIDYLSKIDAKLGKYAVFGNHDGNTAYEIMEKAGFKNLENSYDLIYQKDNNPILINGIGDKINGNTDIKKAFEYFKDNNNKIYTVTLLHEPDSIDDILIDYQVDLALSGHSHNGQVRLPYVESLVKIEGAEKYSEPYYKIGDTHLFVSGGIGTTVLPFRLFNHPSINFIRLKK